MPDRAPRIAGAGLLALDVIISEAGSHDALAFAGGTCGNVLSILSFLRWAATPIGFVGDDPAGNRVLADFLAIGVRSAHLIQSTGWATPVYVQRVESDDVGRPRHTFSRSSQCPNCGQLFAGRSKDSIPRTTPIRRFGAPETFDVFFMDRLSDDILSLAESARSRGALVFYEPSVKSDVGYWQDAFDLIDIVKYSADRFEDDELRPFMLRSTRRDLWEVQTLGARGLRYRHHGRQGSNVARWTKLPAIEAARVVDTCGAGDWCSAGLLHGLIARRRKNDSASFANSLRFGQLLAAWACAFVGARGAMYCSDRSSTWAAIKELLGSRSLDLSLLPIATQSKPVTTGSMSACVSGLCAEA